jgi:glycosyltransferase involved in cell wall biosynthesis
MNEKFNFPLVSVVIPTFNREKLVVRAINSVLFQTYKHLEIIVVDDCSSDNTISILEQMYGEQIVLIKNEINSYVGHARNLGVSFAKGDYIAFLDSDDLWVPNKIEFQLNWMMSNSFDICCTGFYVNKYGSDDLIRIIRPYSSKIDLLNILYGVYIAPGSTLILKKNIFISIGGYDETYRRIEDWDFLIKILSKQKYIGFLNEPLANIFAANNFTISNLLKMCFKLFLSNYKRIFFIKWYYPVILMVGIFFELFAANFKAKNYFLSFFFFFLFNLFSFFYNPYLKIHGFRLKSLFNDFNS